VRVCVKPLSGLVYKRVLNELSQPSLWFDALISRSPAVITKN